MARKEFWKSDWFLGVAVAVVVLVISQTDFVQNMEPNAGARASKRMPSNRIGVIAVDNNSVANSDGMRPVPASSLVLDEIGQRAASIEHLSSPQGVDGSIRTEPLLIAYFDQQTQERFSTGDQMARAIRECAEIFGMVDVVL
jgi:hypothetical protein